MVHRIIIEFEEFVTARTRPAGLNPERTQISSLPEHGNDRVNLKGAVCHQAFATLPLHDGI